MKLSAVTFTNRGKGELSGIALKDDAASNALTLPRCHIDFQIGKALAQRLQGSGTGYSDRIRLSASSDQAAALLAPNPHLLGKIILKLGLSVLGLTLHGLRLLGHR